MTNFQHIDVAHRMVRRRPEARPAPGIVNDIPDSNGGGDSGNNVNPGSPNSPSPTPTPTSTSASPPPTSTPVKPITSSPPPPPPQSHTSTSTSTKNTPPPPTSTPPPPTSKSEAPSTSSTKASSTSSSSSSSSASSTSSVASTTSHSASAVVPTNNAILGNTPTNAGLGASSFANVQPTDLNNSAGATVSADPVNTSGTGGISAGSIVGIVVGVLLGIGLVALCIMFLLRRFRRARRHAQKHESDFGTFNRSAFVREKEPSIVPDMSERSHNVAPSLTGEAMSAAIGAATPPSQALAAANAGAAGSAAHAALQERPKYVFGQPVQGEHDAATEDDASDVANGVYSSQPIAQTEYNPEAYGSYAKYEDVAHTAGGYQDAQREYQGQQGYQGYYDQQGYSDHQGYAVGGYDQQQHQAYVVQDGQYDYSAQHAQYAAGDNAAAAGAYEIQQQQGAYQQPHPYANNSAVGAGHDAAYGGM